jgi:sugar phosphate isomerase/epimerase
MRLGAVCPLDDVQKMHALISQGFEFIEVTTANHVLTIPAQLPQVPFIWQCPADLPAEYPVVLVQEAVLNIWRMHLRAAAELGAALMVVQFRRPEVLSDKLALIDQYAALLSPLTAEARALKIQLVLRMGADHREQLNILREIVRRVPGLAVALDLAYASYQVIKNLTREYLWDSDLAPRLAHVYAGEVAPNDANLRLPLGCLGNFDWGRVVRDLRERYNASVTLDIGDAMPEYQELSRTKWLAWWG